MSPKLDNEGALADEGGRLGVSVLDREDLGYNVTARVDKFDLHQIAECSRSLGLRYREPTGDELLAWAAETGAEFETVEVPGNLLTTAGLARITSLITAGGGQAWDTTHTRIGVGNSATAATIADTDLGAAAGSGNRQFNTADNSTPTTSNGVITIRATFATGVGNFHWQEWCIDNGTGNGTTVTATMMNHKVTDLGTKTSAASWVFTITITLS